MSEALFDRLKKIVGPQGMIDDQEDMQPFLEERRDRFKGKASFVLLPKSTDDVSAIVKLCFENRIGIVPQGGNTGLCGGAIPDGTGTQIVLSLRRMNGIREISASNYSVIVDAGCTLRQVQESALKVDRLFALSLASEGSCQIGGNLSTNAGGVNVLRYGTARSQVLGLEVVLADGSIINGLRSLQKDTAGYDLKQLFIGAEGTLGIITGACLRLQPIPGNISTALLAISSPTAAVMLLSALRGSLGNAIQAFELFPDRAMRFVLRHVEGSRNPFDEAYPWFVLVSSATEPDEFEGSLHAVLEDGLAENAVIAKSESEASALWMLRHSISEAQKPEGHSLKHDVSVPVARIGDFIEQASSAITQLVEGARMVPFGHVGDGNVHLNVSQPREMSAELFQSKQPGVAKLVYDMVAEFGGSFSAEHGVGIVRREELARYRSSTELATMRAIKAALDPRGIMNPGKVL